jgi:hypothetical protein
VKKILQKPSSNIERLLQHGRYLDYLTKRLLTYLPAEFSGKVTVLGFSFSKKTTPNTTFGKNTQSAKKKRQTLVVTTISSAWASKLRFYTPTLKRSLIEEPQFSHIQTINIKVTSQKKDIKKNKKNPIYSQNSAIIIADNADHITDKKLKEALIRLSLHVSEKVESFH